MNKVKKMNKTDKGEEISLPHVLEGRKGRKEERSG